MSHSVRLRIPRTLVELIRGDLERPHSVASERVGFLACRVGQASEGELLILAKDYIPVDDVDYIADWAVGARIKGSAIRDGMQHVLDTGDSLLHVHIHGGRGVPSLSSTDKHHIRRIVQSFSSVGLRTPHGILLLSEDMANAWIWLPGSNEAVQASVISIVGYPLQLVHPHLPALDRTAERFSRQSFLGGGGQTAIARVRVAIVGLGGGGSHIAQQLSYLGIRHFRLFDGDYVDDTNMNRMIGATPAHAQSNVRKADVIRRAIEQIAPGAHVETHEGPWQDYPELLRGADLTFGGVDSFSQRRELEIGCRRYLVPYIDIGMDVHQVSSEAPRMAGQVILSMPGGPCMSCIGFLTEDRLSTEGSHYGAAGSRPQIVWANGVLASTAVGLATDLLTGWSRRSERLVYLLFDGNQGTVTPHVRLSYPSWPMVCPHYPPADLGDPAVGLAG